MYVCICKQVTDHQIVSAIEQGVNTVPKLESELGVSTCCGECKGCVRNLLRKNKSVARQFLSPLPEEVLIPANSIATP